MNLRTRLGLALAVSLLLVFTLQWGIVTLAIRSVAEGYVRSRLAHDSESLLAATGFDAAGRPHLDAAHLDTLYQRPFSGHYFVLAAGAVLRSRSLWDEDLHLPQVAVGRSVSGHARGPQGQPLLQVTSTYEKQGHAITISVAEDLSTLDADIHRFGLRYALISGLALLALLGLQAAIVYRGLRPIARLRSDVARLEHGEIAQLPEDVPAELRPLVREFNGVLKAMDARLRRSREALANLAHALKTPLTLLKDLIARDVHETALRARLAGPADHIHRLIDRELKRARLAGTAPGQQLDLAGALPPLLEAMKTLYRDKALRFDYAAPAQARTALDREDALELLGNIIDNACRWARSRVRVTVRADNRLHVLIEDDGPGVPAEKLALLSQRGTRLDEEVQGHGLGLAIAADIVAAYGGEIRFERARLGGLAVDIVLPMSAQA